MDIKGLHLRRKVNDEGDIIHIPFRIVCIFILLIFAGVYWVQSKLCPCEDDKVQLIAQYGTFGGFGEFVSVIIIIAGAAVFACLGYRMMETILHLSYDTWGKTSDHRTRVVRRTNTVAFILILILMFITAAGIIGYIWLDANTYAVITEKGYEEKGLFGSRSFVWEDLEYADCQKDEEGNITEIRCVFRDGTDVKIKTERFEHSTAAFDEEFSSREEFWNMFS